MPMTDAPSPMDVVTGLLRTNTLPNPRPPPYVLRLRPRSPGARLILFFLFSLSSGFNAGLTTTVDYPVYSPRPSNAIEGWVGGCG